MNIFEHHLSEIKKIVLTEKDILQLDKVDKVGQVDQVL